MQVMTRWIATSALGCLFTSTAHAHVKWFSQYRFDQQPVTFAQLNHPAFWALVVLSVVTLGLFVWTDRKISDWGPYVRLNERLAQYEGNASLILRIFTGAALLLAWQADSMIAPELKIPHPGFGWYQFLLALLMLSAPTSALAGLGMIGLWFAAMPWFGLFHLLDYLVYPAIGFFLLVSQARNTKLMSLRVPALYFGLGWSLCWAALEKIFYPDWGLEVLSQQPALTMGLDPQFFLLAAAFIELCLGYLLIIGLLQRPLALTITLVFFITTSFFGKAELIGHTILHGALLVFIVVGRGRHYTAPVELHRDIRLRVAFTCVNFLILGGLLMVPYRYLSERAALQASKLHSPVEQPASQSDVESATSREAGAGQGN